MGCGGLYDVVFARMNRPCKGGVVVVVARGHSVREFKCVRAVVPWRYRSIQPKCHRERVQARVLRQTPSERGMGMSPVKEYIWCLLPNAHTHTKYTHGLASRRIFYLDEEYNDDDGL